MIGSARRTVIFGRAAAGIHRTRAPFVKPEALAVGAGVS